MMNYPLPFNPTGTIRYGHPEDGYERLTVDILGREVELLVDERQTEGCRNVTFDASNVTSGVCFYKLVAGEFSVIRKRAVTR
jgi:hypothetical protein